MAAAPDGRDPPAAITEDLIREILLRFRPDDPSSLLRDTLVCKPRIHAPSVDGILRRLHEVHGEPPVLGFLHNAEICLLPSFVPDTAKTVSLPAPDSRFWRVLNHRHGRALNHRHGRALFISVAREGPQDLLVWDRITGNQRRVPAPSAYGTVHFANAAVLCAVDGCDHRDCHGDGGPFRVVFTCIDQESQRSACVYSSETETWGELTTFVDVPFDFTEPGVVVGSSLVYFAGALGFILEYDLAKHRLNWFKAPDMPEGSQDSRVVLMLTENGGLGSAIAFQSRLYLWSREQEEDGGEARWVQSSVINLANLLPVGAIESSHESPEVMGLADGANTIFMSTVAVLFSIELHPEPSRNACPLIPIVSFYTPPGCKLQAPAGDVELEGKKEKTLEWVHELFGQGSKLMGEGNFRNAVLCLFLNQDLKNMIACHGRLAPECASAYYKYGCVLLHKAQAASSSEEGDSEKGDNVDSDLDLAKKMFGFARAIVEKSPEDTMEKVKILFAMADVSLEGDDLDSLPGYYYKASSILENLVEPDHHRMVELNFRVYFVLELRSMHEDAIPYCAKAISLCNSHIQQLKNSHTHTQKLKHALEALSVGNDASSAKGGYKKSAREDEIEFFTRISVELMEKLVKLVQEIRTPSPDVDETVKKELPRRRVSGNLARLCKELQVS